MMQKDEASESLLTSKTSPLNAKGKSNMPSKASKTAPKVTTTKSIKSQNRKVPSKAKAPRPASSSAEKSGASSGKRPLDDEAGAQGPAPDAKRRQSSGSVSATTDSISMFEGDEDDDDAGDDDDDEWKPDEGRGVANARSRSDASGDMEAGWETQKEGSEDASEVSDEENYRRTKGMMSLDIMPVAKLKRSERTSDVRLIFTKGTLVIDGIQEVGHWCEVCK
ncbi:hypothetical protein FRC02_007950 [Tulasnella sp. 418]|nr:hypothetical protein FRC02_007950 [Tulasnella sp. 418]